MRSKIQPVSPLRRNRLATFIHSILLLSAGHAVAESTTSVEHVEFNPAFFPGNASGSQIDISRFNEGNVILPGTYRSETYVNGNWIGRFELTFAATGSHKNAQMCLDRSTLLTFGIAIDTVAQKAADAGEKVPPPLPAQTVCGDIGTYIPGATYNFDLSESTLELYVPQIYLASTARGYIAPEHWESGVDAAFLRYSASSFASQSGGLSTHSGSLRLNTGLNVGDWHFRHNGAYSHDAGSTKYQSGATYVQRGLPSIQSQLMAGEIYTTGELFDGMRLLGATLSTDDRMLPDSMTSFAPVVRGVAETNARVSVHQRGMLLHEVTVAPGPFILEDLFPTGYGGDLDVTVTESDGRQRKFIVPFASNANLLRPGYSRYALNTGVLDDSGLVNKPWVVQGTYQYGLSNLITGYAGATVAEDYQSQLVGAAFNTPIGAVSLDVTNSNATITPQDKRQGQSVQARYNKHFANTGTNFALGAFRYSTEGFLSVRDAAQLRDIAHEQSVVQSSRVRERLDISLSQTVGKGSVFLTGSSQHYWNRENSTLSFSAGYSSSWDRMNYTLSAQRSRDLSSNRDRNQIDLTFSLPLGHTPRSPTWSTNLSHSDQQNSIRTGLSGTWGERNELGYGISASGAQGSSGSFNSDLRYRSRYAVASAGYSQGSGYRSQSLDVSGGVVAHSGNLTFAPELGDTLGIVHAPGAEGAWVGNDAQIGRDGYAVVPHLPPYRSNSVELDPKGMSHDVELKTASQNVAPRSGSVVLLKYETSSGRALLIIATREDGGPLPFGADVFDESGASVGVVGQAGKAFVRTENAKGELTARWGEGPEASCRISYEHADKNSSSRGDRVQQIERVCRGAPAPVAENTSGDAVTPDRLSIAHSLIFETDT